jgi:hypothetical protein
VPQNWALANKWQAGFTDITKQPTRTTQKKYHHHAETENIKKVLIDFTIWRAQAPKNPALPASMAIYSYTQKPNKENMIYSKWFPCCHTHIIDNNQNLIHEQRTHVKACSSYEIFISYNAPHATPLFVRLSAASMRMKELYYCFVDGGWFPFNIHYKRTIKCGVHTVPHLPISKCVYFPHSRPRHSPPIFYQRSRTYRARSTK